MTTFNLPDLGEGLREAEIVAWYIGEGDHVVVDQPLVAVETEKAVVEIPSPRSGHIAKLFVRTGERTQVGSPLLEFEEGPHAETGTVVGELAPPPAASTSKAALPNAPKGRAALAAPAVRARARALDVDLSHTVPSGPHGTVTLADVENAAALASDQPGTLRGARRAMAINMARAGREVVPATLQDDADVEHWKLDEDVTIRLIRALIAACEAEPALNSRFDPKTMSRTSQPSIDLGLAVDHPDGLFVPVLRDVARLARGALRAQIDAAKRGVADRSLTPAELREPSITLSNFGTIAGQYAALVIVPPQVAIVGAGRIRDAAVRSVDDVAMHRMLPLSLTFDHRAVTGGEAGRFLRALIADLQAPN